MPSPWTGDRRRDGVRVLGSIGFYSVLHPDGRVIERCPCCGKPLYTPGAAQDMADSVWPLEPLPAAASVAS